jgi:hypothetical protein
MQISWFKTIPQVVKNVRDTIIYAAGGALAFGTFLAPKMGVTPEDFMQICGLVILGSKVVAKFFGVSEEEAVKNVVKAVEEVKKVAKTDSDV